MEPLFPLITCTFNWGLNCVLGENGSVERPPAGLRYELKNLNNMAYLREREIEGHLRLEKVGTDDNLADMFTKVLDRAPFEKFRRVVMNVLLNGIQYLAPRGKRPRSEG